MSIIPLPILGIILDISPHISQLFFGADNPIMIAALPSKIIKSHFLSLFCDSSLVVIDDGANRARDQRSLFSGWQPFVGFMLFWSLHKKEHVDVVRHHHMGINRHGLSDFFDPQNEMVGNLSEAALMHLSFGNKSEGIVLAFDANGDEVVAEGPVVVS